MKIKRKKLRNRLLPLLFMLAHNHVFAAVGPNWSVSGGWAQANNLVSNDTLAIDNNITTTAAFTTQASTSITISATKKLDNLTTAIVTGNNAGTSGTVTVINNGEFKRAAQANTLLDLSLLVQASDRFVLTNSSGASLIGTIIVPRPSPGSTSTGSVITNSGAMDSVITGPNAHTRLQFNQAVSAATYTGNINGVAGYLVTNLTDATFTGDIDVTTGSLHATIINSTITGNMSGPNAGANSSDIAINSAAVQATTITGNLSILRAAASGVTTLTVDSTFNLGGNLTSTAAYTTVIGNTIAATTVITGSATLYNTVVKTTGTSFRVNGTTTISDNINGLHVRTGASAALYGAVTGTGKLDVDGSTVNIYGNVTGSTLDFHIHNDTTIGILNVNNNLGFDIDDLDIDAGQTSISTGAGNILINTLDLANLSDIVFSTSSTNLKLGVATVRNGTNSFTTTANLQNTTATFSGGTNTFNIGGNIAATNSLSFSSGTNNLTVATGIAGTAFNLSGGTNTVVLSAGNLNPTTFNLSGGTNTFTVTGSILPTNSTLSAGTNNISSTINFSPTAALTLSGGTNNLTIGNNLSPGTSLTFSGGTNTVNVTGNMLPTTTLNLTAGTNTVNVTGNVGSTTATFATGVNNLRVTGNFSPSVGVVINSGTNDLVVGGGMTTPAITINNGTNNLSVTGTVTMTGNLNIVNGTNNINATINAAGGAHSLGGTTVARRPLTLAGATTIPANGNVTIAANLSVGTLTNRGSLKVDGTSIKIIGNYVLDNGVHSVNFISPENTGSLEVDGEFSIAPGSAGSISVVSSTGTLPRGEFLIIKADSLDNVDILSFNIPNLPKTISSNIKINEDDSTISIVVSQNPLISFTEENYNNVLKSLNTLAYTNSSSLPLRTYVDKIDTLIADNDTAELNKQFNTLMPKVSDTVVQSVGIQQIMENTGIRVANVTLDRKAYMASANQGSSVWTRAFLSSGKKISEPNYLGYKMHLHGIMVGIDKPIFKNSMLGIAFATSSSKTHELSNNQSDSNITTMQITPYGSIGIGSNSEYGSIDWFLAYSKQLNTSARMIDNIDICSAKFNTHSLAAKVVYSNLVDVGKNFTLKPVVSFMLMNASKVEYKETGEIFALHVRKNDYVRFDLEGGFHLIQKPEKLAHRNLRVDFRALLQTTIAPSEFTTTSNFVLNDQLFITKNKNDRLGVKLGTSFIYEVSDDLDLELSYDFKYRQSYFENSTFVELRYVF